MFIFLFLFECVGLSVAKDSNVDILIFNMILNIADRIYIDGLLLLVLLAFFRRLRLFLSTKVLQIIFKNTGSHYICIYSRHFVRSCAVAQSSTLIKHTFVL